MVTHIARLFLACAALTCYAHFSVAALQAADAEPTTSPQAKPAAKYTTASLRGKIVWLSDALKDRYGINTHPDAAKSMMALDSTDGQLYPLVLDTRGRAFQIDERLREGELELLVRRYEGSPLVQVIRLYRVKPDGKYEVDYWCDICSISMVINKPCDCCQQPTRIREQKVDSK